jgi:hypothetical protein
VLSLDPIFNQATQVITGVLQSGTTVWSGTVAAQVGQRGGGVQLLLPEGPCVSIVCVALLK